MGLLGIFDRRPRLELRVYGMACDRCRQVVEAVVERLDPVRSVSADPDESRVLVRLDREVEPDRLVSAIRSVGYEARPAPESGP